MTIISYYKGKKIWLLSKSDAISQELITNLKGITESLSVSFHIEEAQEHIHEISEGFLNLPINFLNIKNLKKTTELLINKWNQIDLIIYCARSVEEMQFFNFDAIKATKMINLNFLGFINLIEAILPYLSAFKVKQIGVVASTLGYFGLPDSLVYGASQSALINFVESLGYSLPAYNVKLSLVSTGFISALEHNTVPLSFMIDPPDAAECILKGLTTNKFESHFPKRFTYIMKVIRLLPYKLQRFFIKNLERAFK